LGGLARVRRMSRYVLPGALILATLVVAVIALVEAFAWRRQPFPGFFAYSSGLISPMQRSEWEGRSAGLRPGDQVVSLDGVPFIDRDLLRRHLLSRQIGDRVRVLVRRGSESRAVELTLREFSNEDVWVTLATPFSIGIFYLLIGGFLFFLKPRSRPALLVLLLLLLIALFYLTTFDANTSWVLERIWVGYPFFGAVAIHLFTVFPAESDWIRRHAWVRIIPYGIAAVLVVLRHAFLAYAEGTTTLAFITTGFVTAVTFVNFFLLGILWRQATSQVVVRKVKVIGVGLLATSTLGVVWSFAARFDPEASTWDLAMLLSAPFPILMTYAVLKQNIFDVDGVLRQAVTYGLSTVLVLALYFSVVAFFTLVTQQYLPFYETTVTAVLATLAVAVAFHPLRVRVQRLVTRLFWREKYDLGKAIAELTQELSTVTDVVSLGRVFTARLQRLLRVEGAALFAGGAGAEALLCCGSAGDLIDAEVRSIRFSREGPLVTALRGRPRPRLAHPLIEAGRVSDDERAGLESLRARMVMLLFVREEVVGLLVLGGRRFEHVFSDQDLRLLEAMQTPLAIAIENAILYTERAEKERLAALGQVASYIIHEVKNPLAIIRASMGTIKRRLSDDRSRELAAMVEEEVERMNRTTAKILSFARARAPDARPCDLGEVVQRAVSFAEPELAQSGVQLTRAFEPGPPVLADPEQIEALVLNLVLNAKEAVRPGGRIHVRCGAGRFLATGAQRGRACFELSVEDDGVGMDAEIRARLFTPFFTTRRGGTGLGLAIVRHIVDAHRGEIHVASEPGQGTRFTVQFPAHTSEEAEMIQEGAVVPR
jgi:signal transduction histidine kinase